MKRSLLLLLFMPLVCLAQTPWTGIVSSSRAIDWSKAGATIPTTWPQCVTTQCNTVSGGTVTAASINAAIASAPAQTYVLLPSGSFTLTATLDWANNSNVSLRGAGANSTFLTFSSALNGSSGCGVSGSDICWLAVNSGDGGDQNYNFAANWTAGYSAGTTSITVGTPFVKGSISNIQVGSLIFLDQLDDSSIPASGYFVCQLSSCSGGGSGNGREWRPSSQEEPQIVTSISGSGPWTIGISPGVRVPNISGTRSPQIWGNTGLPITNVGIENVSIDARSSGAFSTVFMLDCVNCWVKGVRFIGPSTNSLGTYQVWAYQSRNVTIRDSYHYGSSSTSNNYTFSCWASADVLYENNINQHTEGSYINEGCIGGVQAYNFAIDDFYTGTPSGTAPGWQQASSYHHGVGDAYVLFEGNEGIGATADDVHGTSNAFTMFRNVWNGRDLNTKTQQTNPIILYSFNRFFNIIGNVMGTGGYHTTYQCAYPSPSTCNNDVQIYSLGYLGDAANNDSYTPTSIMRWGNYDVVNNTVRFVNSEVPSGLTDGFSNSVPASQTLPPSFFLASQPSWWQFPHGNTSTPWPAVGPDVTGGNIVSGSGTASTLGGHAYHNSAANCYLNVMNGPTNGAATLLTFDPSLCYSGALLPRGVSGNGIVSGSGTIHN